jgi:hypothetical protein
MSCLNSYCHWFSSGIFSKLLNHLVHWSEQVYSHRFCVILQPSWSCIFFFSLVSKLTWSALSYILCRSALRSVYISVWGLNAVIFCHHEITDSKHKQTQERMGTKHSTSKNRLGTQFSIHCLIVITFFQHHLWHTIFILAYLYGWVETRLIYRSHAYLGTWRHAAKKI